MRITFLRRLKGFANERMIFLCTLCKGAYVTAVRRHPTVGICTQHVCAASNGVHMCASSFLCPTQYLGKSELDPSLSDAPAGGAYRARDFKGVSL